MTVSTDYAPATEPIPQIMDRPLWRDTFSSLRIRNYRLYVSSQIVSNTAAWMQRIAVDWLVLELTGSVMLVGITIALQFGPILVFGAWGGVMADRYPKRVILISTAATSVVVCATLAVMTITGAVEVWHVLLAAFVLGVATAIDGPARSAFVTEMVGTSRLRNAISVNASIFHLGGLVGPALSGILIALVGSGISIGVNAVAGLVVVGTLMAMRQSELRPSPRQPRASGQVRAAVRYAVAKPAILFSLITLAFVATFGMTLPVLLAGMADSVYSTGSAGYGLYSSLAAVGAFVGAIYSTQRTTLRLRSIVLAAVVFGVTMVVASMAPVQGIFFVALVAVGFSRLMFAMAAESMTQLSTNLGIRGRVMSLYIMVLLGGQAVGGPLMGWIGEEWGIRTAFFIAGVVPALAGLVLAVVLARMGKLTLKVDLHSLRTPVSIVRSQRSRRRQRPSTAR